MRKLLIIITLFTLSACQQRTETQAEANSPEAVTDDTIHLLDAAEDKRYVDIQPAGDLPMGVTAKYQDIRLEKSVLVPMRDGVRLSTDIYSPAGVTEPLPVIMIRLPYNKNLYLGFSKPGSPAHLFASQGYHVVVQDMRGRFESEGEYLVSAADRDDGYDTIEWLSKQPWNTGKVGTYGCSYLGENQIQLSATRHPNHLAAIPQAAGGGYRGTDRQFMFIAGGVPELASGLGWFWRAGFKYTFNRPAKMSDEEFRTYASLYQPWPKVPDIDFLDAFWHLPTVDIINHYGGARTDYEDFYSKGPRDPYWEDLNYVDDQDRFNVPALHVNSWYDGGVKESMDLFNLFRENADSERAANNQFAIMSPTAHCASERQPNSENAVIGERPVGDIRLDYDKIYIDWFDYWLKDIDNGVTDMPKLQYYAMGANEWRSAGAWPPEGTEIQTWYLDSNGDANNPRGSGVLSTTVPAAQGPSDSFDYDPGNPVPSTGGPICCISADAAPAGGYDQAEVEARDDVLVYTSAPLQSDLEVTGPLKVVLYVSSSAKDTDFAVKLVDVNPDGSSFNVQDSILRARYREGYDKQVFMEPGGIYKLEIDLHATSNVFLAGHRIRVQVSSSNFPRFVRNLNTGGNNYDESAWVVANNSIHHSAEHPSHILLPVRSRE